jgi:hypothetical protein
MVNMMVTGRSEKENPRIKMTCNNPKKDLPELARSLGTNASGLTAGAGVHFWADVVFHVMWGLF